MNNGSREPQMLAYELAMQQRAQAQGGQAHIYHSPPNTALPHINSSHSQAWGGVAVSGGGGGGGGLAQSPLHALQPHVQYAQQRQVPQQHQQPQQQPPHQAWAMGGVALVQQTSLQPVQQAAHHPLPLWQQQNQQRQLQHPGFSSSIPPHQQQYGQQHAQQPPQQQWPHARTPAGPPTPLSTMPPNLAAHHPGNQPRGPPNHNKNFNGSNGSSTPGHRAWGGDPHHQVHQQHFRGNYPTPSTPKQQQRHQKPGNQGGSADKRTVKKEPSTAEAAGQLANAGSVKNADLDTPYGHNRTNSISNGCGRGGGGEKSAGATTPLFCEPCEKDFATEGAHQAHLQSHVPCSEDGCKFSASRKVVVAHHSATHGKFSGSGFQMISVEGRKFRVLLGTSPEEVEQWRAARRKRWPTQQNMTRKEEEEQQRKTLGGLGPDPGPTGRAGRGSGRGRGVRGRGGRGARGGAGRGHYGPGEAAAVTGEEDPSCGKRAGEDLAGETPVKTARTDGDGLVEGAAVAMVDEGGVAGVGRGGDGVSRAEAGAREGGGGKRICSYYLRGKCAKGEACTFSHDVERKNCSYFMKGRCHNGKRCDYLHDKDARDQARLAAEVEGGVGSSAGGGGARPSKPVRDTKPEASKPTLLRKLLSPLLHRENSIGLQAVRFIVASNFFLDPSAPASTPSSLGPPPPTDEKPSLNCSSSGSLAAKADPLPATEIALLPSDSKGDDPVPLDAEIPSLSIESEK